MVKNILNGVGNNPALPLIQPCDFRASHFVFIIFKLKEVNKDNLSEQMGSLSYFQGFKVNLIYH